MKSTLGLTQKKYIQLEFDFKSVTQKLFIQLEITFDVCVKTSQEIIEKIKQEKKRIKELIKSKRLEKANMAKEIKNTLSQLTLRTPIETAREMYKTVEYDNRLVEKHIEKTIMRIKEAFTDALETRSLVREACVDAITIKSLVGEIENLVSKMKALVRVLYDAKMEQKIIKPIMEKTEEIKQKLDELESKILKSLDKTEEIKQKLDELELKILKDKVREILKFGQLIQSF